jgi:hypothetical protein
MRTRRFDQIFTTSILMLSLAYAQAIYAESGQPHIMHLNSGGEAAVNLSASGGNLINNGGPVLQNSTTYAIFWGAQSAFPSDLKTQLPNLLEGYGSSVLSNILDQYLPAPALSQFDPTTATDISTPPARSPTTTAIVKEVCKQINKGALPMNPVDSVHSGGGVYFVLTSNFPKSVNFCAWHSFGTCNGNHIAVAYIPNLKNVGGCNPGNLYRANSFSEGTRADANVISHELSEAITDPELSAWFDSVGNEIGDKCNFLFKSAVTLANSTTWQLQEEWSNSLSACSQEQLTP